MTFRLIEADCIEAMGEMADDSVDAIVTDPPYGLEFMGKDWDSFRIDPRAARWSGGASGGAGAGFGPENSLPAFGRRRTTMTCRTCGRRDAFRNPHACGEKADWVAIPVDATPMEMRAFQNWCGLWGVEAYRVLKPGGYLLSFGGTRTYHRMACGLEDAGFEIRDCLAWMYGSGFPKSLDVSKAIDKAAGVDREVVGEGRYNARRPNPVVGGTVGVDGFRQGNFPEQVTAPATPDAQRWQGWGTALKPAYEPIVMARKPLSERTVAANVQKWGTGALNIDGCRLEIDDDDPIRDAVWTSRPSAFMPGQGFAGNEDGDQRPAMATEAGRWPANVTLDTEAAAMLDAQTGDSRSRSGGLSTRGANTTWLFPEADDRPRTGHDDAGGASRFFYTPKANNEERNRGTATYGEIPEGIGGGLNATVAGDSRTGAITHQRNNHPTVKPVELMQWLVRMVTPPHGTVVDPFAGSGSTGMAALREGFGFVGIEREGEYVAIARARIIGDGPLFNVEDEG